MTVPFTFVTINTFFLKTFLWLFVLLSKCIAKTPTPNTRFTQRLYSMHVVSLLTHPHRIHGALEDPIVLSQRPHSALSYTLCKRRATLLKIYTTTWRLHSAHTALLATAQRTRWRSAVFFKLWEGCNDATRV